MAKSIGVVRSEVILRMKGAIKAGSSATAFIAEMRESGLSYRRTEMLSDWRTVGNIEKKTGLLKYVRKDRVPSPSLYAETKWDLSREFFYKVKVHTRLKPGEPFQERFVNIVSDKPMTPGEWETQIKDLWTGLYRGVDEQIAKIEPVLAIRRV